MDRNIIDKQDYLRLRLH